MNQFEVYQVKLDPVQGSEMRKTRPAVIISPNVMNKNLATVIVAPMTSTIKGFPSRVKEDFKGKKGEVALDQLRTVDKKRLGRKLGKLSESGRQNVKLVLQTMFS